LDGNKRKDAEPVAVHRMAVVIPFARLLEDIGAPAERGFGQAGLPWDALESADNYVPSHNFYKFIVRMSRSEGIPDLGFRVGEKFGADCADPRMTELLQRAPALYQGLTKANKRINRTVTHSVFGLRQPPNCDYTYYYHSPSCDADNLAIQQIGWFGIMNLIGMVRVYAGPQWQPAEIGLMTDEMPGHYIHEHFPRTRLRLSQPASYIALENTLLTLPPLRNEAAIASSSPLGYESQPEDFVSSLETVLLSYLQEDNLSIELAAELCSTSKRSLQRKLKEMGTNYKEVLGHARFRTSSEMLQNRDMTAADIARHLGYSHETHFARAFRRIAGVSPRVYRQQFIH
jgi:AraC-like DNA-binding protein